MMSKFKMMLVFTIHAGVYDPRWYLRFMLVFTIHAGIACMMLLLIPYQVTCKIQGISLAFYKYSRLEPPAGHRF